MYDLASSSPARLAEIGESDNLVTAIPGPESRAQRREARRTTQEHDNALRKAEREARSLRFLAVSLALEKGEVSIRDLTGVGVFRPLIRPMSDEGFLRRVGYGVYAPGCKAEEFLRQICQLAAA